VDLRRIPTFWRNVLSLSLGLKTKIDIFIVVITLNYMCNLVIVRNMIQNPRHNRNRTCGKRFENMIKLTNKGMTVDRELRTDCRLIMRRSCVVNVA
jgi:hypothetical protein